MALQISIHYNAREIEVRFPYHPRLVMMMQVSTPARSWSKREKCWKLPANELTARWIEDFPNVFPDVELVRDSSIDRFLKKRKALERELTKGMELITNKDPRVDSFRYVLPPYKHQLEALRFISQRMANDMTKGVALFFEMGLGKTKTVIDAARIHDWKDILIVLPKTVAYAWKQEIMKNLPKSDRVMILDATTGSIRKRAEQLSEILNNPAYSTRRKFVLVNYDSLRIKHMYGVLADREWDCVVMDESTYIKTPRAQRTKAAVAIGRHAKFRIIMTGTPITNNYLDLFSQFLFLDSDILGIPTFTAFKATYAIFGGYKDKQVIGFRHIDDLMSKVNLHSLIRKMDDCLDLPDKVHLVRAISLDAFPEIKDAYNNMRKQLLHTFEDGKQSVAKNILTKLLRLQQITSGFLVDDSNEEISFGESPKISALTEFVDEIGSKESVIVWVRFKHDIVSVQNALKQYGPVGVVTGDTKERDRTNILNAFNNGTIRFLVATPRTCGFGISLVKARYCVWFSSSFSMEERYQADARIYRPGQTRTTFYVDLVCESTIDELILTALEKKGDLLKFVMSLKSADLKKELPELQ